MNLEETCKLISYRLQHVAHDTIVKDTVYENIISPFSRIYFIDEGEGILQIEKTQITLEKGYLYLAPSYTFCTYTFRRGMNLIYLHFSNQLDNGLNLYDLFNITHKRAYTSFDLKLIERLIDINPNRELPSKEPKVYQDKAWISKKIAYNTVSPLIESRGIIEQLLSRFLLHEINDSDRKINKQISLRPILIYINSNLQEELSVVDLACRAYMSKDHFARVFKSLTGFPPGEYIIRKRIERAQFLLLTTEYSHSEICEKTGFNSIAYFSRIFSKYVHQSPGKYRRSI